MKNKTAYGVGGLLYTPALNRSVALKIINHEFKNLTSISLCLEDSIEDSALEKAEGQLLTTVKTLADSGQQLPLIFIRIRNPLHIDYIHEMLGEYESNIAGYILPKFDLSNGVKYMDLIRHYNKFVQNQIWIMIR